MFQPPAEQRNVLAAGHAGQRDVVAAGHVEHRDVVAAGCAEQLYAPLSLVIVSKHQCFETFRVNIGAHTICCSQVVFRRHVDSYW